MATYLYCVHGDAATPPPDLTGIDGARIRSIDVGPLVAWVSDVSDAAVAPSVDRLRAHDAVCAAALESGSTPLPIRFGQAFPGDAAAVEIIGSRASTLATRLGRISGCVEIRVVVTRGRESAVRSEDAAAGSEVGKPPGGSPPLESPGTAFLHRLARAGRAELAREVGCEELRHAIRRAAQSLVVDQQRCETARGLAYFPVLVRRADVSAFRDVLSGILPSQAMALSVLGPFAPYSFAGDA